LRRRRRVPGPISRHEKKPDNYDLSDKPLRTININGFTQMEHKIVLKILYHILTFVLFVGGDLRGSGLHLQDKLDALNRSNGGLRHGSGDTTGHEILQETVRVFRRFGFSHRGDKGRKSTL